MKHSSCFFFYFFYVISWLLLLAAALHAAGQLDPPGAPEMTEEDPIGYEVVPGAYVYDFNPLTSLGDHDYGTMIANLEVDQPGRNAHGGPVCLERSDGAIMAFYANTTGHNEDGWTEYAVSTDRGMTWDRYNTFAYSWDSYHSNVNRPVWVEEGLVAPDGTVVLFITQFNFAGGYYREGSGIMRSADNGASWTTYVPIDGAFVGYPAAVAVTDDTCFVLYNFAGGGFNHALYASEDNGLTWTRRSILPMFAKSYGAMCLMEDGRLLAGGYSISNEFLFYYAISADDGYTWTEERSSFVDKKIRDPEVACLGGNYYLHGRSGDLGAGRFRFVLYHSLDGENWGSGFLVNSRDTGPAGYSHNCIINKYDENVPNQLMIQYSVDYGDGWDANSHVFFLESMDVDIDGLPDRWETLHGGTGLFASGSDYDNDGRDDSGEHIAGTIPTDSLSALRLSISKSGASFLLEWPSIADRVYTISACQELGDGFSDFISDIEATPPLIGEAIPMENYESRYFRIEVRLSEPSP